MYTSRIKLFTLILSIKIWC